MTYLNTDLIIQNLQELSDISLQEKLWTASFGPEISSFTEAVCQLYDDSGLGDALKEGTAFNDKIDNKIRELDAALDEIPDYMDPNENIEHEKMPQVRSLAFEILKDINYEKAKTFIKVGEIYTDVFDHPVLCLEVTIEENDVCLEGVSLYDGTYPRGCSVMHSAPDKLTFEEAWKRKSVYEKSKSKKNN